MRSVEGAGRVALPRYIFPRTAKDRLSQFEMAVREELWPPAWHLLKRCLGTAMVPFDIRPNRA